MIVTIRDVERAVCLRFQISPHQLLARNTARIVSRPRQIVMYLGRELTGASCPRLGQHFARDHTGILYAWQQTVKRMANDAQLRAEIEGCKETLTAADVGRKMWRADAKLDAGKRVKKALSALPPELMKLTCLFLLPADHPFSLKRLAAKVREDKRAVSYAVRLALSMLARHYGYAM